MLKTWESDKDCPYSVLGVKCTSLLSYLLGKTRDEEKLMISFS